MKTLLKMSSQSPTSSFPVKLLIILSKSSLVLNNSFFFMKATIHANATFSPKYLHYN